MKSASILAIQLCRFSNQGGQLIKGETLVSCTQIQPGQYPTVPITIEYEVSFINKYSLIVTISHSGTLNRRYNWACIKNLHSSCLYSCNDRLAFNVEESSLNNTTYCILFLKKSVTSFHDLLKYILQGDFVISNIVFGCDNPTCQSCMGIEFAHSISRHCNPAVLRF